MCGRLYSGARLYMPFSGHAPSASLGEAADEISSQCPTFDRAVGVAGGKAVVAFDKRRPGAAKPTEQIDRAADFALGPMLVDIVEVEHEAIAGQARHIVPGEGLPHAAGHARFLFPRH
jgi:hypothetical protein